MNPMPELLQKPFITVKAIYCNTQNLTELIEKTESINQLNQSAERGYTFKAEADLQLTVGDIVMVHSKSEVDLVQVVAVHDTPQLDLNSHINYKWVLGKLDLTHYKKRQKEQEQITAMLARLAYVENQQKLKQRIKEAVMYDDTLETMVSEVGMSKQWLTD